MEVVLCDFTELKLILKVTLSVLQPGSRSRSRRHMWVEFVVGSCLCFEGFSPFLRFSSLHKNQHFQIPIRTGNSGEKRHTVDSTKIPIYYFI